MSLKEDLLARSVNPDAPLIIDGAATLSLRDIVSAQMISHNLKPGEAVALVGDLDASSISTLIDLLDLGVIVMPLTKANQSEHDYFFEAGRVSAVISDGKFRRIPAGGQGHPLLEKLETAGHAGLILFTSGSTGKPKAILHDFSAFLEHYREPRTALTTLNFLLFDHIGGLNTLFHTLFNGGKIVIPSGRDPYSVSRDIKEYDVELLPVTPTFLRLWHLSGIKMEFPALKIISYGTELMDQDTLDRTARAFPDVDIRQTYGMSELGILRLRTRKRDELWISIDKKSAETRIEAGELFLRSPTRMLGYLNAHDPFDSEGWYATGDMVETDGDWIKLAGRKDHIINVGGLKVFPAAVEQVALTYDGIKFAKAYAGSNPLTGMHVELLCEADGHANIDEQDFKKYLSKNLPPHARPRRLKFGNVPLSHRFKQL